MKFEKRTEKKKDNEIDFSQPMSGSKCEKCDRPYKFFIPRPPVRPHYYCMEHLPENKKDWRYRKLREHYLKAMQELYNIEPNHSALSEYEKCMLYLKLKGFRLNHRR